ncbi:MAG: STAS domain-containing protein [Bryobacteraceae bacterium]|jgi:anti-sigma B factor antagonist
MSCKAAVRQTGDVAIVDLSGRITLGDGSGLVRDTIKDILKQGGRSMLLNLQNVTYIDSSGLGELVGAYVSVTNAGGRIKLLNAQGKVTEVLAVTKLYTVFETFSDEGVALRSFQPERARA